MTVNGQEVRFAHFRPSEQGNRGGATVAYRFLTNGDSRDYIELAVALCSPEDDFKRKTGRQISSSRLLAGSRRTGVHNSVLTVRSLSGDKFSKERRRLVRQIIAETVANEVEFLGKRKDWFQEYLLPNVLYDYILKE